MIYGTWISGSFDPGKFLAAKSRHYAKDPGVLILALPRGGVPVAFEILPEPFFAVGAWYSNFTQITDDGVSELLDRAAHERRVRRVQAPGNGRSRSELMHCGGGWI